MTWKKTGYGLLSFFWGALYPISRQWVYWPNLLEFVLYWSVLTQLYHNASFGSRYNSN